MSEAKWTPGPWEVRALPHNGYPYGINAKNGSDRRAGAVGKSVLRWGAFMLPSSAEALANARLIAAAPELFKELDHLVQLMTSLERDGRLHVPGLATLNAARAALAKARGDA